MNKPPISPELRQRLGMLSEEQIAELNTKTEHLQSRPSLDEVANRAKPTHPANAQLSTPSPSNLEPAPLVERAQQAPSVLRSQFPIFSCAAFTLYLQGVPKAPALQTFDGLRSLTLDQACITLDLLTFRSLIGSGRAGLSQDYSANLIGFVATLGDPKHRLQFTRNLYQSENKKAHMLLIEKLMELGLGSIDLGKTANRVRATKSLEDWKETIETYLGDNNFRDAGEYWLYKQPQRLQGSLTPEALAQAFNDL